MNTIRSYQSAATPSAPIAQPASAKVIAIPGRHTHRQRDFGVGYGNSSGYASNRQYISPWATPRFKCA